MQEKLLEGAFQEAVVEKENASLTSEFLRDIEPILAQLEKINQRHLNGSPQKPTGPLKVGGIYGPASRILPLSIYRLQKLISKSTLPCERIPAASFTSRFFMVTWKSASVPWLLPLHPCFTRNLISLSSS